MENVSINSNLVLLGIVEMGHHRYLYAVLAIIIYITTMMLSSMIVYTVWSDETFHEPMYIFIGNLIVNVMFGNSSMIPRMVTDLLFGWKTISLPACLVQAFCYQSFASLECLTFTAMAYDRYLAIGHPLRYPILMTNGKAFRILSAILFYVFLGIGIVVVLASRLSLCGVNINNIYCETMSLLRLACGDITVNNIFGTVWSMSLVGGCILLVIYCYIRTLLVCLKMSGESYQKAIHTLVTHIVTFFTFMGVALFVTFRYRLGISSLSTVAHVAISVTGFIVSITINPVIYGIRMEALRNKMILNLQKIIYGRELEKKQFMSINPTTAS